MPHYHLVGKDLKMFSEAGFDMDKIVGIGFLYPVLEPFYELDTPITIFLRLL
jgi:hypothetical protein